MSRFLTGHQVNPANDVLKIEVLDQPVAGGAHHRYSITGFNTSTNPSNPADIFSGDGAYTGIEFLFQNGPIGEAGVNGITHEALLAILIDRLECFQAGSYASHYNQDALGALQYAQDRLLARTRERMARNVEGTNKV